jgi:hypothetical protein
MAFEPTSPDADADAAAPSSSTSTAAASRSSPRRRVRGLPPRPGASLPRRIRRRRRRATGVNLSSCFLAGDSAAGNVVHHVAQRWASTSARSGRTGRGGGARRGHPAAVDGGDRAFLEGVLAGGRHPGPRGGARVRRGRRPGAGVPGRHGGDRRVRPAQGLAAGKVRGDPVREGEAGPGG